MSYHVKRYIEKMQMFVAWRAPHWLVKWCVIRAGAYATQGKYNTQIVPDLSLMDTAKRWDERIA